MTIIQKKRMELMERAITDLEKIADALKAYGQKKVMLEQGWDVDRFVAEFGKNYLTDRELDELDEERPFFADVLEDWIRESTSSVSADGAATFPASGEGFGADVPGVVCPERKGGTLDKNGE